MVREGLVFVLCSRGSRRVWGLSGDSLVRALIPFLRVLPHDFVTSQTPHLPILSLLLRGQDLDICRGSGKGS